MSQPNEYLIEISEKLDKNLKLLAIDAVKAIEKEQGKIALLDSLGFRPIEIAKFLNKTDDNVNNQLKELRKKRDKVPKQKASVIEPVPVKQEDAKNGSG